MIRTPAIKNIQLVLVSFMLSFSYSKGIQRYWIPP
jgi:hypothetical protein